MDFMRILQSLEEFLYEAMSWVVFYPRAIYRTLRHPVAVAVYTREQLAQPRELQFRALISPPLLLILTVIITHVMEMAGPAGEAAARGVVGKELFGTEQGLIATRSVIFCIFALVGSYNWLRQERKPVDRDSLREPFYIHCYLLAPFVLLLAIALLLAESKNRTAVIGSGVVYVVSCAWYAWAQTNIYIRLLHRSRLSGFLLACRVNLLATMAVAAIAFVIFGLKAV